MIKKILLVAAFALLVLGGINFLVPATQAQTAPNVPVGWGWSSNIGWVKLAGSWSDPVKVDPAGSVTGFGWSPHIGWVSFYGARYVNGELHGGGRACSSQLNSANCSGGTAPNAGGWDGLISLLPTSGSQYGVKLAGNQLAGFSWGSDVVGWTYFNFPAPGAFTCQPGYHEEPAGSHNCVIDPPPTCPATQPDPSCTCQTDGTWGGCSQCSNGGTPPNCSVTPPTCPLPRQLIGGVCACAVGNWDGTTCVVVTPPACDPLTQTCDGKLEFEPTKNKTTITRQSTPSEVAHPFLEFKNAGFAPVTNIHVSIDSLPADYHDTLACRIYKKTETPPAAFTDCDNVTLATLPEGEIGVLQIQVPTFSLALRKNVHGGVSVAPIFPVTISGGTNSNVTSIVGIFVYGVGGTNPQ